MIAYKIMRDWRYRPSAKVATAHARYGNRLIRDENTIRLAQAVIQSSAETGVSFEELLVMCAQIQIGQNPSAPSRLLETRAWDLRVMALKSQPIMGEAFSITFWETLYEHVRGEQRPHCPSRLSSYFAFPDTESMDRYIERHWKKTMYDKVICQIDVSACTTRFQADTTILDRVGETSDYMSALPLVLAYWDQDQSDDPIFELLLQGTVTLGEQLHT